MVVRREDSLLRLGSWRGVLLWSLGAEVGWQRGRLCERHQSLQAREGGTRSDDLVRTLTIRRRTTSSVMGNVVDLRKLGNLVASREASKLGEKRPSRTKGRDRGDLILSMSTLRQELDSMSMMCERLDSMSMMCSRLESMSMMRYRLQVALSLTEGWRKESLNLLKNHGRLPKPSPAQADGGGLNVNPLFPQSFQIEEDNLVVTTSNNTEALNNTFHVVRFAFHVVYHWLLIPRNVLQVLHHRSSRLDAHREESPRRQRAFLLGLRCSEAVDEAGADGDVALRGNADRLEAAHHT